MLLKCLDLSVDWMKNIFGEKGENDGYKNIVVKGENAGYQKASSAG